MPETATGLLSGYDPASFYCEYFGRNRVGLGHAAEILDVLNRADVSTLRRRARAAERELHDLGVTFTVYTDRDVIDRILPFDVIPRIIAAKEWAHLEAGIRQRVRALNLFIEDVYHDEKIFKDRIVPEDLIKGNANYRPEMRGLKVPHGAYVNICGTDIVRDASGEFNVLEDNLRTPSGVSYVIENRHLMMRAFADLSRGVGVADVSDYGAQLMQMLQSIAPPGIDEPTVVVLSPGVFNSAYFEHVFLARETGAALVEGQDLVVTDQKVFMRTTSGLERVHVVYRRIDDDFLDPLAFRPDSLVGVPGIFGAYSAGNVTLANAVGTGIADDKAVYAYIPRIVRYYLDEEPILQNIPTNICREPDGLQQTLDNLDRLVTKPVGESGGYGVVIGPMASQRELKQLRAVVRNDPANYISQPVVDLSVCPTLIHRSVEPRHVDLRPFALTGESFWVLPGGLSRVAMRRGSLIVNSSQGGGSKDTWVLV